MKSFIVLTFMVLSVSGSSAAEPPCAPDAPRPISEKDMAFLNEITSGLKTGLNETNCTALACQKYLTWEKNNYMHYPACSGFFVDARGNVGPETMEIAELIAGDIKKSGNQSAFMQDYRQYDGICPGYKKMNASERVGFYSWVFELIAFPETTCKATPENNGANVPHGPAVGLYQLEYDPMIRSWRGPLCAISREKILTSAGNTGCAFEIFKAHLLEYHDPFGTIDSKGRRTQTIYWQSLNPTPPVKRKYKPTKRNPHPGEDAYHRMLRYLSFYPACGN